MRVLLDTHIWLWALTDAAAIPASLRDRLRSTRDTFLISAASAWEIAIKASLAIPGEQGSPRQTEPPIHPKLYSIRRRTGRVKRGFTKSLPVYAVFRHSHSRFIRLHLRARVLRASLCRALSGGRKVAERLPSTVPRGNVPSQVWQQRPARMSLDHRKLGQHRSLGPVNSGLQRRSPSLRAGDRPADAEHPLCWIGLRCRLQEYQRRGQLEPYDGGPTRCRCLGLAPSTR